MKENLSLNAVIQLVEGIETNERETFGEKRKKQLAFPINYKRVHMFVEAMKTGREFPTDIFTLFVPTDKVDDIYLIGPGTRPETPTVLARHDLADHLKHMPKIKLKISNQLLALSLEYRTPDHNGLKVGIHHYNRSNWLEEPSHPDLTPDGSHILFITIPITKSSSDVFIISADAQPIMAIAGNFTNFDGTGEVSNASITLSQQLFL